VAARIVKLQACKKNLGPYGPELPRRCVLDCPVGSARSLLISNGACLISWRFPQEPSGAGNA
jgi:hypothetical protein